MASHSLFGTSEFFLEDDFKSLGFESEGSHNALALPWNIFHCKRCEPELLRLNAEIRERKLNQQSLEEELKWAMEGKLKAEMALTEYFLKENDQGYSTQIVAGDLGSKTFDVNQHNLSMVGSGLKHDHNNFSQILNGEDARRWNANLENSLERLIQQYQSLSQEYRNMSNNMKNVQSEVFSLRKENKDLRATNVELIKSCRKLQSSKMFLMDSPTTPSSDEGSPRKKSSFKESSERRPKSFLHEVEPSKESLSPCQSSAKQKTQCHASLNQKIKSILTPSVQFKIEDSGEMESTFSEGESRPSSHVKTCSHVENEVSSLRGTNTRVGDPEEQNSNETEKLQSEEDGFLNKKSITRTSAHLNSGNEKVVFDNLEESIVGLIINDIPDKESPSETDSTLPDSFAKVSPIQIIPKSISVRSDNPTFGTLKKRSMSPNSPIPPAGLAFVSAAEKNRSPTKESENEKENEASEKNSDLLRTSLSEEEEWEKIQLEVHTQGTFKTELCNKWEQTGKCPYNDRCQFAHGFEELRPVLRHPRYKTELCRMVVAGVPCPYGHRCHFRHRLDPEEKILLGYNKQN